jgi:hypothetical protein
MSQGTVTWFDAVTQAPKGPQATRVCVVAASGQDPLSTQQFGREADPPGGGRPAACPPRR